MDIARVLKKSWPTDLRGAPPRASKSDKELCGSTASHFEVSKTSRLSFFETGSVTAERSALAVALSRKEVDDVDYLTINKASVASLGIGFESNLGQTALDDVNHSHVDGCDVTLARLNGLVIVSAQQAAFHTLSSRGVVEQLCQLMSSGQANKVNKDLKEKVKLTRVYKRIAVERDKAGLPPAL